MSQANMAAAPRGNAVFESDAAGQRMRVQETFDKLERAAVIPMQFVAPVQGLLFEERLQLAHGGLAQIDDVNDAPNRAPPPVEDPIATAAE